MSDDPHATTDDHADEHGGADHATDEHAHGGERLGPIDVRAWGAGLVGILLGLAVVLAFVLATTPL